MGISVLQLKVLVSESPPVWPHRGAMYALSESSALPTNIRLVG